MGQGATAHTTATAAVLRFVAELARQFPDAQLLQADTLAAALQPALAHVAQDALDRPDGPVLALTAGVRAVLAVIYEDAQTYKSGTVLARARVSRVARFGTVSNPLKAMRGGGGGGHTL